MIMGKHNPILTLLQILMENWKVHGFSQTLETQTGYTTETLLRNKSD